MKKIYNTMLKRRTRFKILIFILGIFMFSNSWGQIQSVIQVNGYVNDIKTNAPIENQKMYVIIAGSTTSYHENIFTDANGYYEDTIHTTHASGMVIIYTYDCKGVVYNEVLPFGGNSIITANFSICDSVGKSCTANFYALLDTTAPNMNYFHFFDNSSTTSSIDTYFWNFGDGITSNLANPYHIFTNPGEYNVCLTITTTDSCTDTYCDTIRALNPSVAGCDANFYYYPDSSNPYKYHFITTSNATNPIKLWAWTFTDTSNTFIDTLLGPTPDYTFPGPGSYVVCHGIHTDSCFDYTCDTIIVGPVANCIADYNYVHDTAINTPNFYRFYDKSTANSNITSYLWNFGDGYTSTDQNPTHQFPYEGSYDVTLSIETQDTCSASVFKTVVVGQPDTVVIGGTVFAGTYPPIDKGIAYLYKSFNNNFLIPVDTVEFDTLGFYYFFNVVEGYYRIKVAPHPTSIYYNTYTPTYLPDELFWINGTETLVNSYHFQYNVNLNPIVNTNGSCSISGNVFQGNKSNKAPMENMEVLLLDMQDNPVRIVYSNQYGDFDFSSIGYGTFKIYAEATGKVTQPVTLTIDANNCNVTGVNIEIQDYKVVGYIDQTPKKSIEIGLIYPNPVLNEINFNLITEQTKEFTFELIDIVGKTILSKTEKINSGDHVISIPIKHLKEGIYLLQVSSSDGLVSETKRFLKNK